MLIGMHQSAYTGDDKNDELPVGNSKVYFKEHPLNYNYKGTEDSREWLCLPDVKFKSFFKHWNYVVRQLLV